MLLNTARIIASHVVKILDYSFFCNWLIMYYSICWRVWEAKGLLWYTVKPDIWRNIRDKQQPKQHYPALRRIPDTIPEISTLGIDATKFAVL